MSADLEIALTADPAGYVAGQPIAFNGVYRNAGTRPLALTFWWNRNGRLVDSNGRLIPPGPGPVLPCGIAEEWVELAPGQTFERAEPLACTQPAGRREPIGWSYAPGPGTYRFTLVFEAPPPHGFTQSRGHDRAFRGRVESNEVTFVVRKR
jgi:hypothetical protein